MNEELKPIAQRVNWFEPLEKVAQDVDLFLVYLMNESFTWWVKYKIE